MRLVITRRPTCQSRSRRSRRWTQTVAVLGWLGLAAMVASCGVSAGIRPARVTTSVTGAVVTTTTAPTTTSSASSTSTTRLATTTTSPLEFDFTASEFTERWNASAADGFEHLTIADLDSTEQDELFQIEVTPNVYLVGSVAASGDLLRTAVVAGASGDQRTNADTLAAWATLVSAVDPDVSDVDRGRIFEELGIVAEDDTWATEDGYTSQATVDGVRYVFENAVGRLGTLSLGAEPAG